MYNVQYLQICMHIAKFWRLWNFIYVHGLTLFWQKFREWKVFTKVCLGKTFLSRKFHNFHIAQQQCTVEKREKKVSLRNIS